MKRKGDVMEKAWVKISEKWKMGKTYTVNSRNKKRKSLWMKENWDIMNEERRNVWLMINFRLISYLWVFFLNTWILPFRWSGDIDRSISKCDLEPIVR